MEVAVMERALETIRGCVQLAWWDGSCLDLRLHRLTDFIDFVSAAEPSLPCFAGTMYDDRR
jgi:hypothetical protein